MLDVVFDVLGASEIDDRKTGPDGTLLEESFNLLNRFLGH